MKNSMKNHLGNQTEPDINIAIYDFVDVEFVSRILDRLGQSRTLVKPCISMIKFYRRVFFPFIDSSLLKLVMKRENSAPGGCWRCFHVHYGKTRQFKRNQ